MTEDNKYYTPTIEEFHIGFELEFKNSMVTPVEFRKEVCEWETLSIAFDTWEHEQGEFKNEFRVKYLDREDIESLGYSLKEELDWRHPKGPATYFKKSKDSGHERMGHTDWSEIYARFYTNSVPSIEITKGRSGHESGVEGFEFKAFSGSLKNKSELNRLMKQIRITND